MRSVGVNLHSANVITLDLSSDLQGEFSRPVKLQCAGKWGQLHLTNRLLERAPYGAKVRDLARDRKVGSCQLTLSLPRGWNQGSTRQCREHSLFEIRPGSWLERVRPITPPTRGVVTGTSRLHLTKGRNMLMRRGIGARMKTALITIRKTAKAGCAVIN